MINLKLMEGALCSFYKDGTTRFRNVMEILAIPYYSLYGDWDKSLEIMIQDYLKESGFKDLDEAAETLANKRKDKKEKGSEND